MWSVDKVKTIVSQFHRGTIVFHSVEELMFPDERVYEQWWLEDDNEIVLFDPANDRYMLLQEAANIHEVGMDAWASLLFSIVTTQCYKGTPVVLLRATFQDVWD